MTQTMAGILPVPQDAMQVRVIGHQWWWEVEYPDLGIRTANELHFPVGQNVRVDLRAADVIHSFWVSELGPKMDLLPEHDNAVWYRVERPGEFRGFCAEFCGMQHANMGFIVVAEEQSAFDAWVQAQRQPAPAPVDPVAQQGAQAFGQAGCAGCHAVVGTPAQGRIGPDLTHVGSRRFIAANTLRNTPENMTRWLTNPQEPKPGNLMPALPLNPDQVAQLTAYLESLR
jgi:cytochrome c oxidase subunit 2